MHLESHTHFDQEELWQLAIFLISSSCFCAHDQDITYSSTRPAGGGMALPQVGDGLASRKEDVITVLQEEGRWAVPRPL